MEDLTAPNHSVSFGKNFVRFKRKKLKFYSPAKVSPYEEKVCPRS